MTSSLVWIRLSNAVLARIRISLRLYILTWLPLPFWYFPTGSFSLDVNTNCRTLNSSFKSLISLHLFKLILGLWNLSCHCSLMSWHLRIGICNEDFSIVLDDSAAINIRKHNAVSLTLNKINVHNSKFPLSVYLVLTLTHFGKDWEETKSNVVLQMSVYDITTGSWCLSVMTERRL